MPEETKEADLAGASPPADAPHDADAPQEPAEGAREANAAATADAGAAAAEANDAEEAKERSALNASGASQLPPATVETLEAVAAAVGRLRAEVLATSDRARKARLLHEAAEIQESGGDEQGAARDYLSAFNADPSFREPLEGLVRLLERRRSLSNLGKLIETLVDSAATPEERARALTQRALFVEDVQKDLEGARGAAREAAESGANPADLGPAWLALEMVAAKLGDATQREEALAGRAELTDNPTWRGLLLIDTAELAAAGGDIERALGLLSQARDEGGGGAFHASLAAERIVRAEPGLPGSDDARSRSRALAEALEAQAQMIRDAMTDEVGSVTSGDDTPDAGIPRSVRRVEYVVDLFMRAADARRLASELARGAQLLDRALDVLSEAGLKDAKEEAEREAEKEAKRQEPEAHPSRPPNLGDDDPEVSEVARPEENAAKKAAKEAELERLREMERLVLSARLRYAELAGDTALAAELAERRLVGEADGGIAAALAMRVAEHAASEGDIPRALAALSRATERDPAAAPPRALKIDILEATGDGASFATELEELSRHCTTGEAQGRALVLAAYVWATRGENAVRAREALGQAEACGVAKETVARLGRSLASLRADAAWYEDATRALVEELGLPDSSSGAGGARAELPPLWIELARMRLAQGDEAGAAKATAALRELPDGVWLGRVLDGLAAPDMDPARSRTALEELAATTQDGAMKRSLRLVCALRAREAGDDAKAVLHLEALAKDDPGDPVIVAYLGDLLRLAGKGAAAASLAVAAGDAGGDDDYAGARYLEAGFERWRLGDRAAAVGHFETASEVTQEGARATLAWAARGVDVETLEGRRRALVASGSDAALELERFALEAALGDPDEAGSALATVEITTKPAMRLAGALARLAWPKGAADAEATVAALAILAAESERATIAAAAERLRLVRESEDDPAAVTDAARAWFDTGGGGAAAIEWLASTIAGGDPSTEVPARRALAELAVDESREALHASATLLAASLAPEELQPLVAGSSHAARLANLELSPPGCEARRRAGVLSDLDGALGNDSETDALGLAAWSLLAAGDPRAALDAFRAVTSVRDDDLHAWEGMRTCAEELEDHEAYAVSCEQLGARCHDHPRGAAFWEQAALAWTKLGSAFAARAESSLDASFARDPTRPVAFDRLFRMVRERRDGDKLLALIDRRLQVTDASEAEEVAKLYWEQARVLREKGDPDGALEALDHVVDYDPDHVGALALTGEIFIRRGLFQEAAEKLAHLARIDTAPPKNRVTAGVAAVDLYENKLGLHDRALEVLIALHRARLTTLPVRERLARAAARTGAWPEATKILEELMVERPEAAGRIEAARLAMAIHRDRLMTPSAAVRAASQLLGESPTDGEALDLVVGLSEQIVERRPLLERGRDALVMGLHDSPNAVDMHRRLGRIANALGDNALEQAALSCAVALGGPDGSSEQMIALYSSQKPRTPHVAIGESMMRQILASGDDGPLADLFVALGPTLGEAMGPTRESLGVTKRDRVDPKAGTALRTEIAQWAGAFGISTFELYVGGRDPGGVQGIAGDPPAIVVGSGVNAPLSPTTRARVVRELISIVRGTTVTRTRDDATITSIVIAACNLAKVKVEATPSAGLAEVERAVNKAIARKTKALIEPLCRAYVAAMPDVRQWAARARATQARAAVLASGDVSVVLADVFSEPIEHLGVVARDDLRAHELFRFVLSRPYFDLRRGLGLEGRA